MEATSSSIHKYALIAKSNLFRSTTCIGAQKLRYTEPFQINNKPNILSINFDWAPLEMLPSFFGEMEKPIHTFFALFMSVYRSFHKATHKLNARKMRCGLEKKSYNKFFPQHFHLLVFYHATQTLLNPSGPKDEEGSKNWNSTIFCARHAGSEKIYTMKKKINLLFGDRTFFPEKRARKGCQSAILL